MIVWVARVAETEPGDVPGGLFATREGGLALATANGRLVLEVVQRAGGRRMTAAEFRRGNPAVGDALGAAGR